MMPMIQNVTKQGIEKWDLFSFEFAVKRKIKITGEITDQMAEEIISQIEYLDSINHDVIHIVINSPGGSVTAGLAILDAMNSAQSEIETICTGQAASMGAFLAACGGTRGRRYITKNAEMMIHQPIGGALGQAADVELTARHLIQTKGRLIRLLAQAVNKTEKKISSDMDRDYWMNAEEAVAYGLADHIR